MIRLAITCGDPCGIGPEIILKSLKKFEDVEFVLIGPKSIFDGAACEILETADGKFEPGKPTPESSKVALEALEKACDLALRSKVHGIVTAPVSKACITAAGMRFVGHTEFLAQRCGVSRYCMFFDAGMLRVALVTTHVPLKKVPHLVKPERIVEAIELTRDFLTSRYGIQDPRIAVCGLNPHAGESGMLGSEDEYLVKPAIEIAKSKKCNCTGPHAPDSVFRQMIRGKYDAVVSMYHDNGLAAVKTHSDVATNVTIGLPFIRTSPDHGTGFDIAGKGSADSASCDYSISRAIQFAKSSKTLF